MLATVMVNVRSEERHIRIKYAFSRNANNKTVHNYVTWGICRTIYISI